MQHWYQLELYSKLHFQTLKDVMDLHKLLLLFIDCGSWTIEQIWVYFLFDNINCRSPFTSNKLIIFWFSDRKLLNNIKIKFIFIKVYEVFKFFWMQILYCDFRWCFVICNSIYCCSNITAIFLHKWIKNSLIS